MDKSLFYKIYYFSYLTDENEKVYSSEKSFQRLGNGLRPGKTESFVEASFCSPERGQEYQASLLEKMECFRARSTHRKRGRFAHKCYMGKGP